LKALVDKGWMKMKNFAHPKQKLGWKLEITTQQMCAETAAADLTQTEQYTLLKANGYNVIVSAEQTQ